MDKTKKYKILHKRSDSSLPQIFSSDFTNNFVVEIPKLNDAIFELIQKIQKKTNNKIFIKEKINQNNVKSENSMFSFGKNQRRSLKNTFECISIIKETDEKNENIEIISSK